MPWKNGHHKNRNNNTKEWMEELNADKSPKSTCINEVFNKMHSDVKGKNFDPYDCDHKIGGMSGLQRLQLTKPSEMNKDLDIFGNPSPQSRRREI